LRLSSRFKEFLFKEHWHPPNTIFDFKSKFSDSKCVFLPINQTSGVFLFELLSTRIQAIDLQEAKLHPKVKLQLNMFITKESKIKLH
jgi:hypothetical protein